LEVVARRALDVEVVGRPPKGMPLAIQAVGERARTDPTSVGEPKGGGETTNLLGKLRTVIPTSEAHHEKDLGSRRGVAGQTVAVRAE
jgi:hypothetical protein